MRVSNLDNNKNMFSSSRKRFRAWWRILAAVATVFLAQPATAQDILPIGAIQGRGLQSQYQGRVVGFRGIVTGTLEDENSQGTRFYTVFVQDLPGAEDGDPLTSDGIAIFAGARRPALNVGDIATFSGIVTEFYGLTELDNNDLHFTVESRNNSLPEPVELEPPADNAQAAIYLEQFESMRVTLPRARVVGPAHVGCGFQVVRADTGLGRILINHASDPVGQIVGVLHNSDVACDAMPDVALGDEIEGLVGPLTFHFDRFKIVYQNSAGLMVDNGRSDAASNPPQAAEGSIVIATFNVSNYFDTEISSGHDAEPQPSPVELALKQTKLAATLSAGAGCPEFVGLQEVENEELLAQLAERLEAHCGFRYEVSHLDSPDARGAETALLSDPRHFIVGRVQLRQVCSDLDTGIVDPIAACQAGQYPLFSRPPLQVEGLVDGNNFTFLVNHFKSKRGGVQETAARRLAQAGHLRQMVQDIQATDPAAKIVVLGDFNDYDGSQVMKMLSSGQVLDDALRSVPGDQRYSYIFDGASQLIDWILVSPPLVESVVGAGIVHTNADYPYRMANYGDAAHLAFRSSDHDVPYVILDLANRSEATRPAPTSIATSAEQKPETSPAATVATADQAPATTAVQAMSSESIPSREVVAGQAPQPTVTGEPQSLTAAEGSQQRPLTWAVLLLCGLLATGTTLALYRRSGRGTKRTR